MNQTHFAYGYDVRLDSSMSETLSELKGLITRIDQGQGIVAIYDMGSIKIMLETIQDETNIKIRPIQIPITLIGIDAARKSSMGTDIENVYDQIQTDLRGFLTEENQKQDLIISLCHTGEGGALQLKNYINQYSNLGMKVKALSVSDKEKLVKQVLDLQKVYHIHAFVGTFDPKLLGIPFISISQVFEHGTEDLDSILMFKPILTDSFSYTQIYQYFEQQFHFTPVAKLKRIMPDIMDEICLLYDLSEEQRVGLFVHIGSLVENVLAKEPRQNEEKIPLNMSDKMQTEMSRLRKLIRPLETTFKIIITDNEIYTILRIIKQI